MHSTSLPGWGCSTWNSQCWPPNQQHCFAMPRQRLRDDSINPKLMKSSVSFLLCIISYPSELHSFPPINSFPDFPGKPENGITPEGNLLHTPYQGGRIRKKKGPA